MKKLFLSDKFILIIITLNALFIFIQGFHISPLLNKVLIGLDNACTTIFIVELLVKLNFLKPKGYFSSNWNILDFVLVILAIPSLIIWLLPINVGYSGFLLVFRIFRVFKFFRFIKFLPNVEHLIEGINRALKSSVIVLLGFFVFLFVIAVLSCFMFKGIAPEYFENPVKSFYSIFQIFTVEGWFEIPALIADRSTDLVAFGAKLYFALLLLVGGIFGLSLVNSIFVDAMVSDNNDELELKIERLESKIDRLLKEKRD